MSDTPAMPYDYQSEGGALLVDAPTYVKRKADDELYEGLKAGQFCYVLNARQMGKSSLKVRTLQRLRDEGIACAAVDLQGIGTSATEEQWYFGVTSRIARSLGLHRKLNLNTWWTEQPRLSYVQRFVEFLESVLLPTVSDPIVIFIDEVDLTLTFPFRDDFFGALRETYNHRADEPEFRRLTFALFGVASPSDLIQNKQITPFNIGRPVDLTGFQLEEAQPLRFGLTTKAKNPQAVLQAVLDWTEGQPFLTQKLCKLVQLANSEPSEGQESEWVEQLVQTRVIESWEAQDIPPHLKTIRDRLLLSGEEQRGRLLGLYQQIVQHGEIAADDSPEQVDLRLTGLVVKREGMLRVYNRVYQQVFDRDWLERSLSELRPYGSAISAWLGSGCQDESRLLRGQALQDARTWAAGKSLGDDDRRFLDASQELEKRDIQKKLAAEEEAKQVLAEANQESKRLINRGKVTLAVMIPLAVVLGGFSIWISGQANKAQADLSTARKQTESTRSENEKLSNQNQDLSQQVNSAKTGLLAAKEQERKAKTREQQANQNLLTAEQQVSEASKRVRSLEEQANVADVAKKNAERDLEAATNKLLIAQKEQRVAQQEKADTERFARIEQRGIALLQQPIERFSKLEALVSALEAGQDLARLSKNSHYQTDGSLFNQNSTASATIALRIALNAITEQNRIIIPQLNYSTAEYSFDKKFIKIGSFLFDWLGNHVNSDDRGNPVFQSNESESCRGNNEAFNKDPEIPYQICWSNNAKIRQEQYYKDSYYKRLYDFKSGQFLAQVVGLQSSFSPDSALLISGNNPYTGGSTNYHFYNLTNIRRAANIQGSYAEFSPNGAYLVTNPTLLKNSAPVRLYDKLGNFLFELEGVYPQFSRNNRHIVTHSKQYRGHSIYLYDLNSLDAGFTLLQGDSYPQFSPDGQYLAVEVAPALTVEGGNASSQNNVRLYEPSNLKKPSRSFDGVVPRFSPDSSYLLTQLTNGEKSFVRVYELSSSNFFDIPFVKGYYPRIENNFLIAYVEEGKSKIYDLRSFPPRSASVIVGKEVGFLDLVNGEGQRFLSNTTGDISRNKDIILFDSSGKELAKFRGNFAKFSPDNQYIIVSAFDDTSGDRDDGLSSLYDHSGHLIKEFRGSYATFNRDGKRLLVSSASETSIYDTSGRLLSVYPGIHPALSPDEKYLVTFLPNGTGHMWRLDGGLDDLLKQGCSWLDAYLNNNPDVLNKLWVCQTKEKRQLSAKSLAIQFEIWGKQTYVPEADKARLIQQFLVIQNWNPSLPAKLWNEFCWFGSLNGYATQTSSACEKAVSIEPTTGEYRDSRGLAKALTGNTQGAINDFQAFIQWLNQYPGYSLDRKVQRQQWINDLRAGKPASAIFTKEVLERLRKE
ncbi:AAA-like domain-containing protein [Cyanobacteria bacterium FACHB-63]|nr:AAA-like domain-containing protein [Cyanobacteria bacterium FACHB-63]